MAGSLSTATPDPASKLSTSVAVRVSARARPTTDFCPSIEIVGTRFRFYAIDPPSYLHFASCVSYSARSRGRFSFTRIWIVGIIIRRIVSDWSSRSRSPGRCNGSEWVGRRKGRGQVRSLPQHMPTMRSRLSGESGESSAHEDGEVSFGDVHALAIVAPRGRSQEGWKGRALGWCVW